MAAAPSNPRSGVLLVDKPEGITSHGVVSRVRKLAGTRKVGHAGTLDPMATGLLVLGVNSSTRLLTWVVGLDKEYTATIRLGSSTTTDDREGEPVFIAPAGALAAVNRADIEAMMVPLTGHISQVPSTVSAIKVDGKRAYALARAGETVELKSRPVLVSEFELLAVSRGTTGASTAGAGETDGSTTGAGATGAGETGAVDVLDLEVRVSCSSGTYIRALARDLGAALGVGGHLIALRRTRIGPLSVADAAPLATLDPQAALLAPGLFARSLFAAVELDEARAADLGTGKRISVPEMPDGSPIAAIAPDGRLVGLISTTDGVSKVLVNFPPDAGPSPEIPKESE